MDPFWTDLAPSLPQGLSLSRAENGVFLINLNTKDARTLLFILIEYLASNAKNITDVFASLLNEMWGLRLSVSGTNLGNAYQVIRKRNSSHPIITVVDPLITNKGSWLEISKEIRNQSQHRDATQILKTDFGRPIAPYLSPDLLPTVIRSERSLDVFCPKLVDRVYQFIEDISSALCASPSL